VEQSIYEPLTQYPDADPRPREVVVDELLATVGLDPRLKTRYPSELTSGEQQRVAVARALATGPELIVLDEPTSSLDPVAREHLIDLLKALQRDRGMALLFISHDLVTVRHIAHRVAVMYLGEIVESGPVSEIFSSPVHPYTQALIAAVPSVDRSAAVSNWARLVGEIPSPIDLPPGCYLASRCAFALPECTAEHPQLLGVSERHQSRCARTTGVLPAITSRESFERSARSPGGDALSSQAPSA
jgi:oligopeptide/dipeptide ABC transporter ATP-binding protein